MEVPIEFSIHAYAEAVLAFRFPHGGTASPGRSQHHGHARPQALGPFGSAREAYEAAEKAKMKLGMTVEVLDSQLEVCMTP